MNKLMKYNAPVLMSIMCQHCINTGRMVDSQHVMRWLQVSKPTALQVLEEYRERGYLERFTTQWRPNAKKYDYRPVKSVFTAYRRGDFKDAYLTWIRSGYK